MPFGFGVGDFLTVGTLVWNIYKVYESAPEQFRSFSKEILSLHIVIRKVEDQLGISGSNGTASGSRSGGAASVSVDLSTKDENDLKILYDGLKDIVKELSDLLQKYQHLASNPTISFDRFKWGKEDLVGLREKIQSNITLLTAFNATLAKYVRFKVAPSTCTVNLLILAKYLVASLHTRELNLDNKMSSLSRSRSSLGSYLLPEVFAGGDQLHPCIRLPHSLLA